MVHHTFNKAGETSLDTRDLKIKRVYGLGTLNIEFTLGDPDPLLGSRLTFVVPDDLVVMIEYTTSPEARGIQWMSAELAGGKPFAYTQGEAINARTYIPCQDTPSVKFTFAASITVPSDLRGLIAASDFSGRRVNEAYAVEDWDMPYPIPSYLIAFAVGDLVSMDISDRSRVWAQPNMIEKAAAEFGDISKLMAAGEKLFGEYPFGRYDMLVMPAAFPYGGMENPCLSFLTPALITGDGSGISTVAHELAHSWTGNLVTNADWDAFWLNEGWTVWAEDRIVEEVYGRDTAMLGRKLLEREFVCDCAHFKRAGEYFLTKLAHGHNSVDPDDVFSRVPYFKGAQFLTLIENTVGRKRFDQFARSYISRFKYQSIRTQEFLAFVAEDLGQAVLDTVRADEWVYGEGLPDNAPSIDSDLIGPVENLALSHRVPASGTAWNVPQLQLYLELLPRPVPRDVVVNLDSVFGFRSMRNTEVRWSFLVLAIQSGYMEVLDHVEALLRSQGRMKYLKPLYGALAETSEGLEIAERIFNEARSGYHPVAISVIEKVLSRAS